MSYGYQSNVGLDDSMCGALAQECQPSTMPRPTGMCKRYAMNVPPTLPYINPQTGVRRKIVCPKMDFDEGYTDATDLDTEVEDDFAQAEEDCRAEMFSRQSAAPMPWANRYNSPEQWPDSINRLENLIREETEEIEQSQKYLKHADVVSFPKPKGFWELSSKYRNRAMGGGVAIVDADNLDPDVAAAMMASEEQGQVLKHIPPAALFNRLFPEDNRKCTLLVKGASKYHRDHVVPERGTWSNAESLMSDVDAGILPYGDMIGPQTSDDLPQPLFHPDQSCPDGICESPKKQAKVQKLKANAVDDEGVELTWAAPKEASHGYQVYYAPASPDDKKSKAPLEWSSVFTSSPKVDLKWSTMDPNSDGFHIAVSPVGDSPPPASPTKDASKLEVKRPKHKGKTPARMREPKATIENVQARNVAGGVEVDWDTPPHAREGALVQFKSEAHTKMQYKATVENLVFLPVPEKQGKVYIALEPRTSGSEPHQIVELLFDIQQGRILTMQVNDNEDDNSKRSYTVSSLPPLTGNFIQLRGSQPPPWFPGYFTIQPGVASVVPLNEPQEALEKAWASMGPAQVASPHGNFLLGKP